MRYDWWAPYRANPPGQDGHTQYAIYRPDNMALPLPFYCRLNGVTLTPARCLQGRENTPDPGPYPKAIRDHACSNSEASVHGQVQLKRLNQMVGKSWEIRRHWRSPCDGVYPWQLIGVMCCSVGKGDTSGDGGWGIKMGLWLESLTHPPSGLIHLLLILWIFRQHCYTGTYKKWCCKFVSCTRIYTCCQKSK